MAIHLGRIQLLAKPANDWAINDAVLLRGQIGAADVETMAPLVKMGDGVRPWSQLPNMMAPVSAANDYVAGTVTTLPPGSSATVNIDNTVDPPTISFGIPKGAKGDPNVLTIGTVVASAPGGPAAASITGTSPAQVLNLVIPRGEQGPQGVQGEVGPPNELTIGTVTTGAAGTPANATITGTPPDQILNLTIPKGDTGAQGPIGPEGPQGDVGPIGPEGPQGDVGPVGPQGPAGSAGSASPGGATTHVQFNNAGAFAGDADLTWDLTNNRLALNATNGQIRAGEGNVANPTFTFANDTNTGMYLGGTDYLQFATNGAARVGIDTASLILSGTTQLIVGNTASPHITSNATIAMTFRPGDASGASAGAFTLEGARATAGSTVAGNITVRGGASQVAGVSAGSASVLGGTGTDANGGAVNITGAAGVGTNRNGGNVVITAGAPTGSGTAGFVSLNATQLQLNGTARFKTNVWHTSDDAASRFNFVASAGTYIRSGNTGAVECIIFRNSADADLGGFRGDGLFYSRYGLRTAATVAGTPVASLMDNITLAGTTYGSWYVEGARNNFAGISIYDNTLYPTFMSNGVSAGIFIQTDTKWLLYRSTATLAISSYTIEAPAFNSTSSRKIKRETGKPTHAADILSRLRLILYRLLAGDSREQLGMIAEEVAQVCPWLSDGKAIAYDRVALLLLADWQDTRTPLVGH